MKKSISGKTALISGAGAGLGKAIALRLASLGVNLILCGRNLTSLNETKEECAKNVDIQIYEVDVKNEESVQSLMKKIDTLDYLINNAGISILHPFEEIPVEVFDETYATNVRGPFMMSKYALPFLRKSEVPTIINVGSVTSHTGYLNQCAYTASKHALLGMSKVMAKEFNKEDIRVHVLCPGGFLTEMMIKNRPDLLDEPNMLPEDMVDIIEFWLTHRSNAVIDQINVHRVSKEPFL